MMSDALFAIDQESPGGEWLDAATWCLAEAQLISGQVDEARVSFIEASRQAATVGNTDTIIVCASELALLAMDGGDWKGAREHVDRAFAKIAENQMADYLTVVLSYAAAARFAIHVGDLNKANAHLVDGMRARPRATYAIPFLAVRLRIELAKVYSALSNPNAARQLLREVDEILTHRPQLGSLVDQVEDLRHALSVAPEAGSSPLTPAELRVLPYLQTHLTLAAIGQRLFVSRATVSSQVTSIYRKLGVSSRLEAVEQATTIGLLGG
jgi:LuxR family maltose regulon positive regulatory protein